MKKLISITALLFILNVNLNFGQNKTVLNNKSNLEYFLSNSINDTINKTLKKRALSCDSVFCLVSAQKNYYGGTLFEIDTKDKYIMELLAKSNRVICIGSNKKIRLIFDIDLYLNYTHKIIMYNGGILSFKMEYY